MAANFVMGRAARTQQNQPNVFADVVDRAPFEETQHRKWPRRRTSVIAAHRRLLEERYDLLGQALLQRDDDPRQGRAGRRARQAAAGVTWQLGALTPDEIRRRNVWPAGFLPLPHPNHPEGGMLFPKSHIDEVKKQTDRDLARFDLDFDARHFLPEFPPPIFLTTRPDLGDVSKGKLITLKNFYEIFSGILNPKQLEGLRLLVTPFPQQQFNATDDRRSARRATA